MSSPSLPDRDPELDALKDVFSDLGFKMEPKRILLDRDEAEIRRQRREYWDWSELDNLNPYDRLVERELDSPDLPLDEEPYWVRAYLDEGPEV